MKKQAIASVCAALLVLLFLYASLSKFTSIHTFVNDMHKQPFPRWINNFLIVLVPLIEIGLSGLLLREKTLWWGLWGSLILMALFTIYTLAVLKGTFGYVPCSCGGVIRSLSWHNHLYLNIFFDLIAFTGILTFRRTRKSVSSSNISYT